jgi:predicted NUDIX family NTP pyrophosphohydrolase
MSARAKQSAGLLMYRLRAAGEFEVLLVHPGGPFFARRDDGYWTIPKGEYEASEGAKVCAIREFEEEIGVAPVTTDLIELGSVKQRGGKVVHAWAFEGDWQGTTPQSNSFELEWPPRSGRIQQFPEVDRAEFFARSLAARKINAAQVEFLTRLAQHLTRER